MLRTSLLPVPSIHVLGLARIEFPENISGTWRQGDRLSKIHIYIYIYREREIDRERDI